MRHHHLDRRDGTVYLPPSDDVEFALRITEITGRPLLLSGDPGTGKSSLAAWVAAQRNWRYYEHTVTARTEAADLLWTFDAVRKLADASRSTSQRLDDHDYVEPGPLWWAFARDSALRRGRLPEPADASSRASEPHPEINERRSPTGAVVLVDEIDKADPDVPNALLVPLGSGKFKVAETDTDVEILPDGQVLVVITTNRERDLPSAFERRCVLLELDHANDGRLAQIADAHFLAEGRGLSEDDQIIVRRIAKKVVELRKAAEERHARPPGIAEFLDAVWTCIAERIDPDDLDDRRWALLESMTLRKDRRLR